MKKKSDRDILDEYQKLRDEMIIEQVNDIFRNNPANYREELEKIGFQWFDDDDGEEKREEASAIAENDNQDLLVRFFNGEVSLKDEVLETFLSERNREEPNLPLFRKYFKKGNQRLKALLLFGLKKNPTDRDLLNDLSYFHEFHPMLGELIHLYMTACERENDVNAFRELAEDFFFNTVEDGYEALYALKELYGTVTDKGFVIDQLLSEQEELGSVEI